MKTFRNLNLKNKKVLVRCDFNVPLDERGKIEDDLRIKKTLPTIEELVKREAKVVLMSHLGRPGSKPSDRRKYSLKPVATRIEKLLGKKVKFLSDCVGTKIEKEVNKMEKGEVVLLENLRFYLGEERNDQKFARNLAKLGEVFINDAFGVSHRVHASLVGVPKLLPPAAGLLLENEIKVLRKLLINPKKPLVGVIGGAKISTKIKPIRRLLKKAEHLLLGGKIANALLAAKGISVAGLLPQPEVMKEIKELNLTNPRLHLPIDVITSPDPTGEVYTRIAGPGDVRKEELLLDIGPETVNIFSEIIREAKMIFWNGPLGKIEEKKFTVGSLGVARAIIQSEGFSVVGGNNTLAFLKEYGLQERFDHLSTGGGAMLEFLSGEELPGLAVLE